MLGSPLPCGDGEALVPTEHLAVDGVLQIGLFPVALRLVGLDEGVGDVVVLQRLVEVQVSVLVKHLQRGLRLNAWCDGNFQDCGEPALPYDVDLEILQRQNCC